MGKRFSQLESTVKELEREMPTGKRHLDTKCDECLDQVTENLRNTTLVAISELKQKIEGVQDSIRDKSPGHLTETVAARIEAVESEEE